MKKILLLLTLSSFAFFSACSPEIDDAFDTPTAERVNQAVEDLKTLLTSADNGWHMEYYPNADRVYGGFNLFIKFTAEGSEVVVASEIADADQTAASLWEIVRSDGPVLSLNTYNDLLHVYSDPDITGGGGYGGDFEFVYTSMGDNNTAVFKGLKTRNIIKLTRIDDGISWTEYMTQLKNNRQVIENELISQYVIEELELTLTDDDNYSVLTLPEYYYNNPFDEPENPGDLDELVSFPYRYTTDGIEFYETITIAGVTFKDMQWDAANKQFIDKDTGAVLKGIIRDNVVSYEDLMGRWSLQYKTSKTAQPRTITIELSPAEGDVLSPNSVLESSPLPGWNEELLGELRLRLTFKKSINGFELGPHFLGETKITGIELDDEPESIHYEWYPACFPYSSEYKQASNSAVLNTRMISRQPLSYEFFDTTLYGADGFCIVLYGITLRGATLSIDGNYIDPVLTKL